MIFHEQQKAKGCEFRIPDSGFRIPDSRFYPFHKLHKNMADSK